MLARGVGTKRPTATLDLGDPKLLEMTVGEAAACFGIEPPSGKETVKSGATKRKQSEIEDIRLRLVANG